MNYFLDTCVKIGYVFCTDPWNKKSAELFNKIDTFYNSHCVKKEFDRKYNTILKEQKNFLYSLKNDLQLENLSKKLSLKDLKIKSLIIPLQLDFDENKKECIAEVLWEQTKTKHIYHKNKEVCAVKDLISYINRFTRGYERILINRKNNFEKEVIQHPKRDEKYMDLNEKLLYDAEIHYPDNCIILDAHDLSLKDFIDLQFITTDNKMISKIEDYIDLLSIDDFHYLNDFIN